MYSDCMSFVRWPTCQNSSYSRRPNFSETLRDMTIFSCYAAFSRRLCIDYLIALLTLTLSDLYQPMSRRCHEKYFILYHILTDLISSLYCKVTRQGKSQKKDLCAWGERSINPALVQRNLIFPSLYPLLLPRHTAHSIHTGGISI